MPKLTDTIKDVLAKQRASHNYPALLDQWSPDMETQVNVETAGATRVKKNKGDKSTLWEKDGFIFGERRIADGFYDKKANGRSKDYCDDQFWRVIKAIGITGRDFTRGISVRGFVELDSLLHHGKRLTAEQIAEIEELIVEYVPWAEVQRSSQGAGRHIKFLFPDVPTKDRHEHADLCRFAVARLSKVIGVDLALAADAVGYVFWIWNKASTKENQGLALIQPATAVLDVPDNWHDLVPERSKSKSAAKRDGALLDRPRSIYDAYNEDPKVSIEDLLREVGGTPLDDSEDEWLRPGDTTSTRSLRIFRGDVDVAWCFTPSWSPLQQCEKGGEVQGYTAASLLRAVRFGGDGVATVKQLGEWGCRVSNGEEFDVADSSQILPIAQATPGTPIDLVSTPAEEKDWPKPFAPCVYENPIGQFVVANAPHTEADMHNVFMNMDTIFGNYLGRNGVFRINNSVNHTNDFLKNIGDSGARKETAWDDASSVFRWKSCEEFSEYGEHYIDTPEIYIVGRVANGVSTGEGIIELTRDDEKAIMSATHDGRLIVRASELVRVMSCMRRESSILSPVLREGYDGKTMQTNTKTNPASAKNAHVSLIADVTPEEYRHIMRDLDAFNGFHNREQYNMVKRSDPLPDPGRTPDHAYETAIKEILKARKWMREKERGFYWSPAAQTHWANYYIEFCQRKAGAKLAALTRREPTHVVRMSMRLAAFRQHEEIQLKDLEAAIDVARRCTESVKYVESLNGESKEMVLLDALFEAGDKGLSRTQIRSLFSNHLERHEIDELLRGLQRKKLARGEKTGRGEKWYAVKVKEL